MGGDAAHHLVGDLARDIARELGEVWGAIDIQQQSPPGMPQVNVTLRPTDLQSWGLDAVEVLELIRTAYQGDVVGQAYEGNVVFNVIVKLDPEASARPIQIGDMPIRTPSGAYVLLKQIADVYGTSGRYVVLHRNGQRVQTVTANVAERDLESFVAAAKRKIAKEVKLPPGAHVEFTGAAEAQAKSRRDLVVNASLALTFVALPHYVRLTRAAVLVEVNRDYVTASRVAGAGAMRQMFVNILPNCLAPLIVQASLGFSNAILDMAALGFLGMGAQ
ncbi:MAG: efflux RND transporter permease subunit, partial [Bradyrhizobium sp.]|nr:efflux RND transporter permease subunit [Bradyrhizobium sp.]